MPDLKMDYFGSKFPKIAKRWGFHPQILLPLAAGGFALRPPFRLNDQRMYKTLLPLKLLKMQMFGYFGAKRNLRYISYFLGQNETYAAFTHAGLITRYRKESM